MDFYSKFAEYYELHSPDNHYISNVKYINYLIKKNNIKSILDIGCGNGSSLSNINKEFQNELQLDGFDLSQEMINIAKKRKNNINFFVDDMIEFHDITSKYDFIISMSWVINYSKTTMELEKVLKNIYNSLTKDGLVLLEVPHIPNIIDYTFCDKEKIKIDDYHSNKIENLFLFFKLERITDLKMKAIYNLIIQSKNIIMYEEHILNFCNALYIKKVMKKVGYKNITIMDNPKEHKLHSSYNVLIKAFKTEKSSY